MNRVYDVNPRIHLHFNEAFALFVANQALDVYWAENAETDRGASRFDCLRALDLDLLRRVFTAARRHELRRRRGVLKHQGIFVPRNVWVKVADGEVTSAKNYF